MSYLLDTCILSKARKTGSDAEKLKQWFAQHPETSYFISVLSIGEIQTGISKLTPAEHVKKRVFEDWLLGALIPRFKGRIVGIDIQTCSLWGRLRGDAQRKGLQIPSIDALIAASAMQHQFILVTENTKDFLATGVPLVNPLS